MFTTTQNTVQGSRKVCILVKGWGEGGSRGSRVMWRTWRGSKVTFLIIKTTNRKDKESNKRIRFFYSHKNKHVCVYARCVTCRKGGLATKHLQKRSSLKRWQIYQPLFCSLFDLLLRLSSMSKSFGQFSLLIVSSRWSGKRVKQSENSAQRVPFLSIWQDTYYWWFICLPSRVAELILTKCKNFLRLRPEQWALSV